VLPGRFVEKHVNVAFPLKRILRDPQVSLDRRVRPLRYADELRHRKTRLGVKNEMVGFAVLPGDGLDV